MGYPCEVGTRAQKNRIKLLYNAIIMREECYKFIRGGQSLSFPVSKVLLDATLCFAKLKVSRLLMNERGARPVVLNRTNIQLDGFLECWHCLPERPGVKSVIIGFGKRNEPQGKLTVGIFRITSSGRSANANQTINRLIQFAEMQFIHAEVYCYRIGCRPVGADD